MKTILTLLAFLTSPLASSAWPLFSAQSPRRNLNPRSPATYSVVPVDGGSSTEASAPTQTITLSVTQTLLSTSISTLVMTENDTPSTIYNTVVVTLTSVVPTTIYNTVSLPGSTETTTSIDPLPTDPSASTITIDAPAATITVEPPPVVFSEPAYTVTEVEAPSSTPYDDGMWHTTYYHYWTPSPSSEALPEATTSTSTWDAPVDWTTDPTSAPFPELQRS